MKSIRLRIQDLLRARLAGDETTPMPPELGTVKITTNRSTPVAGGELPTYSLYFLQDAPTGVGDPRRPVVVTRKLLLEARLIVKGTDTDSDPHCQWVTARIVSADRCIDADGVQLAMSVNEAETPFEPLEGTQSEVTVTRIRFTIEYKTNPVDITKTA